MLVLDLLSGADLSLAGVLWALGAMVGCATYFIISADENNGLPPLVAGRRRPGRRRRRARRCSAWSGCCRCAPRPTSVDVRRHRVRLVGAAARCSAWSPPALAYVAGIAAIRRLGSRLASFVALTEVVAGVVWAWLLLDELPRAVQLLGGLLILAGVVGVKLGEREHRSARSRPRSDEIPGADATSAPSRTSVVRGCGGDRAATRALGLSFDAWVEARVAALLRFAYLVTGSQHAAEDAVQSALERACEKWSRVRRADDPDAYVRRMVVNAHVSGWRAAGRRESPVAEVRLADQADPADAGVRGRTPSGGSARGCPPQQRAAVVLRFYEDLDYAEIAAILGVAEPTAVPTSTGPRRTAGELERQERADG